MKKVVQLCSALLLSSGIACVAHAISPGGYLGLGLGGSQQQTPNDYLYSGNGSSYWDQYREKGGAGGRVFAGYNFNRFVGLEAGYAQYAPSKYDSSSPFSSYNMYVKYNMSALDLVTKLYIPLGYTGFSVYGLGGAALVRTTQQVDTSYYADNFEFEDSYQAVTSKLKPIAGLGASFDIPSTPLSAGLEYSHIFGENDSSVPGANLFTLNLACNFG